MYKFMCSSFAIQITSPTPGPALLRSIFLCTQLKTCHMMKEIMIINVGARDPTIIHTYLMWIKHFQSLPLSNHLNQLMTPVEFEQFRFATHTTQFSNYIYRIRLKRSITIFIAVPDEIHTQFTSVLCKHTISYGFMDFKY